MKERGGDCFIFENLVVLGVHDGDVTGVTSGVTSELHVTFVTCNSLVTHL